MIDGDDKLKKAYRELGADEPGPKLDQAILAAAHRAVAPKRAMQRWAVPVSLAAVLVLAVGVTLRMQQESPGIEIAPPTEKYTAPPSSSEPAVAPPPAASRTTETPAVPAKPSEPKLRTPALRKSVPAEEGKAIAADRNVEAPPAPQAAPQPPQQPKAFADSVPATAPTATPPPRDRLEGQAAPAAPRAQSIAPPVKAEAARAPAGAAASPQLAAPATVEAPMAQAREKRNASDASVKTDKESAKDAFERELDRIARLRREGRNAEADEALEKFQRDNPRYRIPDALWEQVKPR